MKKLFCLLSLFSLAELAGGIGLLQSAPVPAVFYGQAAWYSSQSCRREGTSGALTASGERFHDRDMTCALRHRDFGKYYRVTNLENGKSIVVKHNDFGPARQWRDSKTGRTHDLSKRVVDLSKGAFQKIANPRQGVIKKVRVERISR